MYYPPKKAAIKKAKGNVKDGLQISIIKAGMTSESRTATTESALTFTNACHTEADMYKFFGKTVSEVNSKKESNSNEYWHC